FFGGVAFIFVFGAISSFIAAAAIAIRVHERPRAIDGQRTANLDLTEFAHEPDHLVGRARRVSADASATADGGTAQVADEGPASLANRLLVAAALFSIVAAGSPIGRPSTAQGLYGAAGTLGFVVASLVTGGDRRDRHPPPVLRLRDRDDHIHDARIGGRRGTPPASLGGPGGGSG